MTILFLTRGEMPERWKRFHREVLLEAVKGAPILAMAPFNVGVGWWIRDDRPKSYWNIYHQMLVGARLAKTPYVAVAEDDVLYTKEHFDGHRPAKDAVAYDRSRWSLFSWDPIFCLRQRLSNCSLVASREYLIDALEDRERQWPCGAPSELVGEVGREKVDDRLKVPRRKREEWYSKGPIVQLNHPGATEDRQARKWKAHGQIKAVEIPHWGRGDELVKYYLDD